MIRNSFFQVSLLLIVMFCSVQCKRGTKDSYRPDPAAIALNDEAAMKCARGWFHPDSLRKAITLLDRAIAKDSDYQVAYGNKAQYLTMLGETSRALETLNTYLRRNPADPYGLFIAGILYEKMGNKKDAMVYYRRADVNFKRLYEKDRNYAHELNRCIVIGLTQGVERGKAMYQKERNKLASDEKHLRANDAIMNLYFDVPREQFINEIWTK